MPNIRERSAFSQLPGIGCPVISSLGGATAVLAVTEPSISGRHDLERVAALGDHFAVPCLVLVNQADLYPAPSDGIEPFAWQSLTLSWAVSPSIRISPGLRLKERP